MFEKYGTDPHYSLVLIAPNDLLNMKSRIESYTSCPNIINANVPTIIKGLKLVPFEKAIFCLRDRTRVSGWNFIRFVTDAGTFKYVSVDIECDEAQKIDNLRYRVHVSNENVIKLFGTNKWNSLISIPAGKHTVIITGTVIDRMCRPKIVGLWSSLALEIASGVTFPDKERITNDINDSKHIIESKIKALETKSDRLSHYKASVYRAYLYRRYTENSSEDKAVQFACNQMNTDYYKYKGDPLLAFMLFRVSDITTHDVPSMIHFIDGFVC